MTYHPWKEPKVPYQKALFFFRAFQDDSGVNKPRSLDSPYYIAGALALHNNKHNRTCIHKKGSNLLCLCSSSLPPFGSSLTIKRREINPCLSMGIFTGHPVLLVFKVCLVYPGR